MRKVLFLGLTGCLALTLPSVAAYAKPSYKNTWNQGWFAGGGVGAGQVRVSSGTQNIYYTPDPYYDSYSTSQTKPTTPIVSVEGGYRWSNINRAPFAYFLGLRYRYLNSDSMNGNILILNNSAFPYGFTYDTSAQTFSLFGKIDLMQFGGFAPYITGGMGAAILRFSNYGEYPKSAVSIARNSAAFNSDASYNFTYDLGFGLDYFIKQNWTVSLGYDYINLGKLRTGNGAYNNITGGTHELNFGTVTANTVFLQTDYMFNA